MRCESAGEQYPHDSIGGDIETEESGAEKDCEEIGVDESEEVAQGGCERDCILGCCSGQVSVNCSQWAISFQAKHDLCLMNRLSCDSSKTHNLAKTPLNAAKAPLNNANAIHFGSVVAFEGSKVGMSAKVP